ncbi:MAG: glycosyltransferase family 4 protein, partial [Candidatus Aureabacteria bacterium]|nr:glycosyltransferase family 4 protein [Candidatus Auribacterota bacterium]
FLRDLIWLRRLLRREEIDLLHSCRPTSHLLAALAAPPGVPLLHLRGSSRAPAAHFLNRWLYRRMTAAVIVSSGRLVRWTVDRLRMPPERVHPILAPVDLERFRPAAPDPALLRELGIPPSAPVVLMVARLAPVKGHDVLVKAMGAVSREFLEARLVLVGKPWEDQPGALLAQARSLGLEGKVICPGHRTDVPRFLSIASVGVMSSLGSEENSRGVGEYMAAARPVVATRVGVVPELVADGATGILVPPGDTGALGEAIADLLRDPAKEKRMGEAGRRRAADLFSFAAFDRRLRSVLGPQQT